MIKSFRNIALSLLLIFVFPIIYQPLHVVWHHSHGAECCGSYGTCQLGDLQKREGAYFEETIDHCPICSYEFSINDIPEKQVIEFYIQELIFKFIETKVTEFVPPFVLLKIPRAPPA